MVNEQHKEPHEAPDGRNEERVAYVIARFEGDARVIRVNVQQREQCVENRQEERREHILTFIRAVLDEQAEGQDEAQPTILSDEPSKTFHNTQ